MYNCFNKTVIICKHILHSCYKKCFNNNNNSITINNSYDDYDINCYCGCINKNIEIKANTLCLYNETFHHVNILLLALLSLLVFIYVYSCYNPIKHLQRDHPLQYTTRYNTLMISSNNTNSLGDNNMNTNTNNDNNKYVSPYEMYDEYGTIVLLPPYNDNANINNNNNNNNANINNNNIRPPAYTI